MGLTLVGPNSTLTQEDLAFVQVLDQAFRHSKLRIDAVFHYLNESHKQLEQLPLTVAEEEEIFLLNTVPMRLRATFKGLQQVYFASIPSFFILVTSDGKMAEFKYHGSVPANQVTGPMPLGPLAGIMGFFTRIMPDFKSPSPVAEVSRFQAYMPVQSYEEAVQHVKEITQERKDLATKASLLVPNTVVRQCRRCGFFSGVLRRDIKFEPHECVPPRFRGEPPWKDKYNHMCACGGSFRFAGKTFV
ncbi:hypothetical protein HDU96_010885 [Phlyctochytrium bullatum]|nr:hypothetical protein HDU96_010885 [Phlyctochytrium bullatum]